MTTQLGRWARFTEPMAAVLAWAAGFGIIAATPAFAQQPNIVHIVADDLKWKDVGYHGSDFSTPNIDRLATTGARLDQF